MHVIGTAGDLYPTGCFSDWPPGGDGVPLRQGIARHDRTLSAQEDEGGRSANAPAAHQERTGLYGIGCTYRG